MRLCSAEHIICVHTFMRGENNFSSMCRHLEPLGYSCENWTYPSQQACIEDHGHALARHLATLPQDEPIDFVTHSMGALVVRAALNDPARPKNLNIGKVVQIAPPNRGSRFARSLYKMGLFRPIVRVRETRLTTPHTYTEVFAGHSWICPSNDLQTHLAQFLQNGKPSPPLTPAQARNISLN